MVCRARFSPHRLAYCVATVGSVKGVPLRGKKPVRAGCALRLMVRAACGAAWRAWHAVPPHRLAFGVASVGSAKRLPLRGKKPIRAGCALRLVVGAACRAAWRAVHPFPHTDSPTASLVWGQLRSCLFEARSPFGLAAPTPGVGLRFRAGCAHAWCVVSPISPSGLALPCGRFCACPFGHPVRQRRAWCRLCLSLFGLAFPCVLCLVVLYLVVS